jgi:hypothetical protein
VQVIYHNCVTQLLQAHSGQYNITVLHRNHGPFGSRTTIAVVIAGLFSIALLILAGTPSNAPVNDDGAYIRMVSLWAEQGRPVFIGWNEMTLLGHLLPGVLLHLAGATSIASLQLLVGLQTVLITCMLCWFCRQRGLSTGAAVMGALAWMVSPLVMISATSFMTEVPAAFWTTCWLVLLAAWLREARPLYAAGWVIAAIGAYSVRQPGIILPFAAATAALAVPRHRRPRLLILAAVVLIADGVLMWYRSMLPLATIRPISSLWDSISPGAHLWSTVGNLAEALVTVVLVLLPLVVAAVLPLRRRSFNLLGTLVAGVIAVLLLVRGSLFPFWGNLMTRGGVLLDTLPLHLTPTPLLPVAGWIVLTMIGVLAVAVLASAVIRAGWPDDPILIPCATAFAGLTAAACLPVSPFDRYLVPALPLAVAMIVIAGQGIGEGPASFRLRAPAVALLIACALLATLPVRHLHRRQQALWQLAASIEATGIEATDIDGGFEWNMWHQPAPFNPQAARLDQRLLVWYEHYPFTHLDPVRRLWIGEVPTGWRALSVHTIPGGHRVQVLAAPAPVADGG